MLPTLQELRMTFRKIKKGVYSLHRCLSPPFRSCFWEIKCKPSKRHGKQLTALAGLQDEKKLNYSAALDVFFFPTSPKPIESPSDLIGPINKPFPGKTCWEGEKWNTDGENDSEMQRMVRRTEDKEPKVWISTGDECYSACLACRRICSSCFISAGSSIWFLSN